MAIDRTAAPLARGSAARDGAVGGRGRADGRYLEESERPTDADEVSTRIRWLETGCKARPVRTP